MHSQPEVVVEDLEPRAHGPHWRHVVHVRLPECGKAPMASCRSPQRAELVAEALRRLVDADPGFAQRVLDAKLAEQEAAAEGPQIEQGTWVLWQWRLKRASTVPRLAELGLVEVFDPVMWDNKVGGLTYESDAAPLHELRVLTDEEGQRRRAEREARGY